MARLHKEGKAEAHAAPAWQIRPSALILIYVGLLLTPLALAYAQALPPRKWQDELSSALALSAYAGLLIEFLLSGRFRFVSSHLGIDTTMRFHQLLARTLAVFVLVHPFLYVSPMLNYALPWDATGQYVLGLNGASLASGIIAWLALMLMVLMAVFREQSTSRYETWRLSHGFAALLVAGSGLHHTLEAGRYSGHFYLAWFWSVLFGIAVFTLFWVYLLKPAWQSRHPYVVRSARPVALKTWELVVEPKKGRIIDFQAGQFVWLNLGRSPFSICENPFSVASAPASSDHLGFVIKEVGDLTRSIGRIAPGTVAYVDGPHGNLTIDGRDAAGIALIAGGVGIAPLLSILRQLRQNQDPRPVVLVYGNRVSEQIVYEEELSDIGKELDLRIEHVLSEPPAGWQGRTGLVDAACVEAVFKRPDAAAWLYCVCGPLPMIESVEQALLSIGVPGSRIVSERFYYD